MGYMPIFYFCHQNDGELDEQYYIMQDLNTLIERTVMQLGYALVDLEISNRGKLLRVFIDKSEPMNIVDSVNIDDCVLVSNQLGNVLTVDHEIDYDRLEVSSPGMDRVLKKSADFVRFVGERATFKLRVGLMDLTPKNDANTAPRKNFIGIIRGVEGADVLFECDGQIYQTELINLDKVRLNPLFGK